MIERLFGPSSLPAELKAGLDVESARQKTIAARVAGALDASAHDGFAATLRAQGAAGAAPPEDLQKDMAELADVQLRFEADARLLHDAYGRLRTAMKSNG